jgi:hypothetical protein
MHGDKQNGSSLIGVLMAAGLMGVVSLAVLNTQNFSFKAGKTSELRDENLGNKRILRSKLDCSKTLTSITCGSGFFPLRDKNDAIIGTADLGAWKLGNFHIRGQCNGSTLSIQTARLATDGTFAKDPLTGKAGGWTDLFSPGDLDCASFFNPSAGIDCPAGQLVSGLNADGTPRCKNLLASVGQCSSGTYMAGFDGSGNKVCATLPTPSSPTPSPSPVETPSTPTPSNPDKTISGVMCSGGTGALAVYLSHFVSTTTICADSAAQLYWSGTYIDCFVNKKAPGNGGSVPAVTSYTSSNCSTYVKNWITQWYTSSQYAAQAGNYKKAFSDSYCKPFGAGYYYVKQTSTCRYCPSAYNSSTGQCN